MAIGALGEFEMLFCASQLTDIFYVLTTGPTKISSDAAQKRLRELVSRCSVASLYADDATKALNAQWSDFEDACVYQCAVSAKADVIITRNQKDFEKSAIPVMDCDEFFAYLEREKGLVYDFIRL